MGDIVSPEARSVAVAAILVSLGRERALRLLERFDAGEIERLGDSATRLGHVEQPRLDALTQVFERDFATGAGVLDGARSFGSILDATRVEQTTPQAEPEPEDLWEAVRAMPSKTLIACLSAEHPNVAAIAVRQLGAETGGELVQAMDPDVRLACMRALVAVRPTPLAEQVALECLTARLGDDGEGGDTAMERDIAAMLSLLDADAASTIVTGLADSLTPAALERIAALVLRFEDLARLSDTDHATLTAQIALPNLVAALAGADGALTETFLATMGQRARKMAEGELQTARTTDAARDAARRDALALARRLADDGALELPKAAG